MAKEVVRWDVISIAGTDISHLVSGWDLVNDVNHVRCINLRLHVDDQITINGRTIKEMIHGPSSVAVQTRAKTSGGHS